MTETFIQGWIQALGGDGYAVAFVLAACTVAVFAVAGVMACLLEVWQERRRKEAKRQRELERSVDRARGGSWSAKH